MNILAIKNSNQNIQQKKVQKKKKHESLHTFLSTQLQQLCQGVEKRNNLRRKIVKSFETFAKKFEIMRENCSRDWKICSTLEKTLDIKIWHTDSFLLWSSAK